MATLTRRLGSSLQTLTTEPPQVAAFAHVTTSRQVAPPCSCRLLSHQTLLWHHRLGHPSLPRLRGMHSRLLVSGLPRSLPPLPPLPALPCLPCVEGRQRAAPHSSFPLMTAPLQTLHMDVWGPARVSGQGRKRYFLLRFHEDLPVLRLHSDRGGEFSSDLLRDFCRGEGILLSFPLPASPHQNGIAERRIGLVMEVARTSMIYAAAPHCLWPSVTGKVGDASVFRVWGSRAFVRDTSADKLSSCAIPCVFLGFPPDVPGWQFYHPTSRCILPSQDVTFDEPVSFYCLFPYRSAPLPPPSLFQAPGPPPTQVLLEPGGAEPGGAEPEGAEPGGPELEVVEPGGAESEGAGSEGAEPRGIASSGGLAAVGAGGSAAGGTGAGGARATSLGGAGVPAGAGGTGGAGAAGPEGARTRGNGAAGAGGVGGTRGGGAGAGDHGAGGVGAGGTGAGSAGAGDAGAGDPGAGGAGAGGTRAGGTGAGGAGAGGAGDGDLGARGAGAGGTGAGGAGAEGTGAVDLGAGGADAGGAAVGST
ncbi:unnamed protein product, partial [Closterium sp. NIES-54]